MIRRYRCFSCKGDREQIIAGITKLVNELEVRHRVPRVCTERSVSPGRNEFYLFVAFEVEDDGSIEDEVRELLGLIQRVMPCRGGHLGDFNREDLKGFVGQDVRVEEFARRLRYKPLVLPDAGDPFADEADDELSLDVVDLTQRFDRLLLWMSAHAEGSFASLDSARRALRIEMDTRRVMRALRLLGHCETSRDGNRWSMAPSVLISTEDTCLVLAGARDSALLQALRERFPTEEVPQPFGTGPSAFRVRTAAPGDLSNLEIRAVFQADRALAAALPHVDRWVAMLEEVPFDPAGFTMRRLEGGRFEDTGTFEGNAGFYQVERAGPNVRSFHLYFSPELGWRRGEWTGLRFVARLGEFGTAPCTFDTGSRRLFVPLDWRWPEIYERALVLSSGQLPTRDDNGTGSWLVYSSVEPELLDLLRPRLQLEVDDT